MGAQKVNKDKLKLPPIKGNGKVNPDIKVYTGDAIPLNWTETDDEALLNEILGHARRFLSGDELGPTELNEVMSVVEKAMRRKRINDHGYDTAPVSEIVRQRTEATGNDEEEKKIPIARLHPDQDVTVI